MDNGNFDNIVLALLFSADEPLSVRKLTSILEHVPAEEIKEGIERMKWALDLNSPNELYIGDRKLVRDWT